MITISFRVSLASTWLLPRVRRSCSRLLSREMSVPSVLPCGVLEKKKKYLSYTMLNSSI